DSQRHVADDGLLKSSRFRDHLVASGRKLWQYIFTRLVGAGFASEAGCLLDRRDFDVGRYAAAFVGDDAGDSGCVDLSAEQLHTNASKQKTKNQNRPTHVTPPKSFGAII